MHTSSPFATASLVILSVVTIDRGPSEALIGMTLHHAVGQPARDPGSERNRHRPGTGRTARSSPQHQDSVDPRDVVGDDQGPSPSGMFSRPTTCSR